jgi:hypothetical protein
MATADHLTNMLGPSACGRGGGDVWGAVWREWSPLTGAAAAAAADAGAAAAAAAASEAGSAAAADAAEGEAEAAGASSGNNGSGGGVRHLGQLPGGSLHTDQLLLRPELLTTLKQLSVAPVVAHHQVCV